MPGSSPPTGEVWGYLPRGNYVNLVSPKKKTPNGISVQKKFWFSIAVYLHSLALNWSIGELSESAMHSLANRTNFRCLLVHLTRAHCGLVYQDFQNVLFREYWACAVWSSANCNLLESGGTTLAGTLDYSWESGCSETKASNCAEAASLLWTSTIPAVYDQPPEDGPWVPSVILYSTERAWPFILAPAA